MRFIKKINKKVIFALLALGAIFIGGFIIVSIYDTQSSVPKVVNYKPNITLKILDRKDRLIANVFDEQFRYYATFDEIPPKVIETLLAVEDTMFFEHNGVNLDAIIRAMVKNIKSGGLNEGGSTITQQLVKNVALTMNRTLDRKLKEAIITLQVERFLNKEEILEKYLNHIFFGNGYYGIKTAAYGYFDKDLSNLTLKEIAMLMALPKAPSYYNPVKNLDVSLTRANTILERMFNLGWIDKDEYENAIKEIPKVYNKTLTQNLAPYVVDEVLRQLSHIKGLKTEGYVVKLNIDLDYQKVAQDALLKGYNNIIVRLESKQPKNSQNTEQQEKNKVDTLNGAIIVTQSYSGNILALAGGIDYTKSNFNRATQAKRQFGSTFKPFIYQIAFDMGYSQATTISDIARSFEQQEADLSISQDGINEENSKNDENIEDEETKAYRPKNYTGNYNGIVSLKEALRRSLNLATINLVDLIGFRNIYNQMEKYGFNNMPQDMSIILGSFVLSPMEATKYYSMFANYGNRIEPRLIRSIINPEGKEIFNQDLVEPKIESITEPSQAYLTINILQDVVNRGTGYMAKTPGIEIAGKTGTSNNNNDAWFSGFSPTLQVVVWYGRDDNTPIGSSETGGIVSAPVVKDFFTNILKIEPGLKRVFDTPNGVSKRVINGEEFYYTNISKLPNKSNIDNINDGLIF
ncbi:MAG: PBP1A family penicillin-binding protein [Helicobacteraceae bacterium]|nr:PBP1A family penicillin-binding protein [Helicobacteraceae bacterium]